MASSSNRGTGNKTHNSIQNWHESFSLLDNDDDDDDDDKKDEEHQDEDLPTSSRRENNRSFVDFLFNAPTNRSQSTSRSNTNNNNNNSLRHDDDDIETCQPVADRFLSPATLNDSFIQRSYPQ
jgi:chromatin segregation and condensation protein Rec8/ScpA/Scc1 (kleisin family)